MSNILLVPIHLDALVLDHDQMVVETTADFTRLPYCTRSYDINPDIANISEELVSTPFQNENLLLNAGIHLHWSLPDALTKARPNPKDPKLQEFPLVPNRWLVTRCNAEGKVQKEWLVESDFLYPAYNAAGNAPASTTDGVAVPFRRADSDQPFRFMGRSYELARQKRDENADYYPMLTAVGYGEPTFAAFYPNCYSVFGFYDDEYSGEKDKRQYYVTGWYNDADVDVLRTHVRNAEDLATIFKWSIDPKGQEFPTFPTRMICYARLVLGEATAKLRDQRVTIAVGNNGTEALSACMGKKLHGSAAKSIAEDHLEAMHLSAALEHRRLDVGAKFLEARHENGFTAVPGGTLWTVRKEDTAQDAADATKPSPEVTLPRELAGLLNVLNKRQAEYDRACHAIESLRIQLFSDWYKYMLCVYPPADTRDAYPDADKVASYVEGRVASLNQKIARTGELEVKESGGRVVATAKAQGSLLTLAQGLANAINNVQKFIDASNSALYSLFKLKQTSGPRYWRPTEPSIVIEGALAEPSDRHGQDAPGKKLLETQLFAVADGAIEPTERDLRRKLREKIAEMADGPAAERNFAFSTWEGQPWNPFLLEWEIEVYPVANKSNIDPFTGHYDEDFISENYQLAENAVDLSFRPGKGATTPAANVYTGRSILTPHAAAQLNNRVEDYLETEVLPHYFREMNVSIENGREYLTEKMEDIQKWYEARAKSPLVKAAGPAKDPNVTAFRAWDAIRRTDSLSQSISGFNEALLMHKQTPQLRIADPLGFHDYRPFAETVGKAVSDSIYSAPEPQNDFNPIRSGLMKIHQLRLVDTFGQIKPLEVSEILSSELLDNGRNDPLVALPPRLMQPARVNFRWLSADDDEEEMNDHPATTPICGWVLANNLDNSLMICDSSGKALGSLVKKDVSCEWEQAPGGLGVESMTEIANLHLMKMVRTIHRWGGKFLDDFISAIDSAVENIEPENFAQHQDLALLMGRPLALVRASVNVELKGLPATHQGWNEFRQDMQRSERDDNGFPRVRFPIRIGAYKQFNDGTVGYWREKGDKYEDDAFFAPQSDEDSRFKDPHLKTHKTDPEAMVFYQTVESEPQILSLLIDPRGLVHATSGIVPTKAISIPPDQYAAALEAIEITFLSTPVLTDAGKIHLPLPDEAGYQWSWLQQNFDGVWSEVSSRGLVRKEAFAAFEPGADAVWAELVTQGWIEPIDGQDDTRANVTPIDQRKEASLINFKDKTAEVEDILDRAHIGPVDPAGKFSGPQEIREGWLKLSPADDAK